MKKKATTSSTPHPLTGQWFIACDGFGFLDFCGVVLGAASPDVVAVREHDDGTLDPAAVRLVPVKHMTANYSFFDTKADLRHEIEKGRARMKSLQSSTSSVA